MALPFAHKELAMGSIDILKGNGCNAGLKISYCLNSELKLSRWNSCLHVKKKLLFYL